MPAACWVTNRGALFSTTRKIKSFVPGFQAVIPFREGIRRTAAWFAADKKRQVVDVATGRQMDEIIKAYTGRTAVKISEKRSRRGNEADRRLRFWNAFRLLPSAATI